MKQPTLKSKASEAFKKLKDNADDFPASAEKDPVAQEIWEIIEPALEDKALFQHELSDHLKENTNDLRHWRTARNLTSLFAVAISLAFFLIFSYLLFCPTGQGAFEKVGKENVKIAILSGCFVIIFGLPSILIKGAFSNSKKEEATSVMPEGGKLLIDALSNIVKKG